MSKTAKIRLFVNAPLQNGQKICLSEEQSRYLSAVMRVVSGEQILLFDGQSGEYSAEICSVGKKSVEVEILKTVRPFAASKDICLLFAPVKKDRTDFIIEKATELGVRQIVPVITRYTITEKTRTERFIAQAIEAAEQSRRLDIPKIAEPLRLVDLLKNWDNDRSLLFMDESGQGHAAAEVFASVPEPLAILVGPEGGFSEEELHMLHTTPFAIPVSLGPLILRAETAVAAALSVWQAVGGSWKKDE